MGKISAADCRIGPLVLSGSVLLKKVIPAALLFSQLSGMFPNGIPRAGVG